MCTCTSALQLLDTLPGVMHRYKQQQRPLVAQQALVRFTHLGTCSRRPRRCSQRLVCRGHPRRGCTPLWCIRYRCRCRTLPCHSQSAAVQALVCLIRDVYGRQAHFGASSCARMRQAVVARSAHASLQTTVRRASTRQKHNHCPWPQLQQRTVVCSQPEEPEPPVATHVSRVHPILSSHLESSSICVHSPLALHTSRVQSYASGLHGLSAGTCSCIGYR